MATTRRGDSKGALNRQRAELRRTARGKAHVGDAADAAAAGRAAELARVRSLREAHARELAEQAHRQEPLTMLLAELAADGLRLARTLVAFPFRAAQALRGHRSAEA